MDPLKLGRARVRIIGLHTDDKEQIPTEDLFWASVMNPVTSSSISGVGSGGSDLKEGMHVLGFFADARSMQTPIIMGTIPGIPVDERDAQKGFFDPREDVSAFPKEPEQEPVNYPSVLDEPDTPRLSRNETLDEEHSHTSKEENRLTEVTTAGEETWDEPENPYNATYPFNRVVKTESGHVIEIDDTPDAERINVFHRSGSYYEILPDGTVIHKSILDQYRSVLQDDYDRVARNKKASVGGGLKIRVNDLGESGNDYDIEVGSGSNINITVQEGNVVMTVNGDVTADIEGTVNADIEGTTNVNSAGNVNVTTPTVAIDGDVTVSGDVTAQGEVTGKGVRLSEHKHPITSGSSAGLTAKPNAG